MSGLMPGGLYIHLAQSDSSCARPTFVGALVGSFVGTPATVLWAAVAVFVGTLVGIFEPALVGAFVGSFTEALVGALMEACG